MNETNMKAKNNYWKIATIILIGILLIQITMIVDQRNNKNVGGFSIIKYDYNNIFKTIDANKPFLICNMDTNKCNTDNVNR